MPLRASSWIVVIFRTWRAVFALWLAPAPVLLCPFPRLAINPKDRRGKNQ